MRYLFAFLLLTIGALGQPVPGVRTTQFSRSLLLSADANAARDLLGLTSLTNLSAQYSSDQFTVVSNNIYLKSGLQVTNVTLLDQTADRVLQLSASGVVESSGISSAQLATLTGVDTSLTLQQQLATKLANTNGSAYGLILPDVTLGALTYRNAGDGTIDGSAISNTTLEGALAGYNTGAGSIEQRLVSGATAGGVYVGSYALLAASSYATNTATVRIIVSNSPPVLGDVYAGEYVNTRPATIVTNADYSLIQSTVDTDVVWQRVDSMDEAPVLQRSLLLDTDYGVLHALSSASREVRNASGDWVNFDEFTIPAMAPGTTNTAALQAAIDTGKDVFIPPAASAYCFDATLTNLQSNQRIFGAGGRSVLELCGSGYQHAIQGIGVTNVLLQGLSIRMPNVTKTNWTGLAAINLESTVKTNTTVDLSDITVRDCNFYNLRGQGIQILSGDRCNIVGNRFLSSQTTVTNDTHANAGSDIYLGGHCRENRIVGNWCVSGNRDGIGIQPLYTNQQAHYNIVEGNTVKGHSGYGIWLYRLDSADVDKFQGNRIVNNTVADITGEMLWDSGDPESGLYYDGEPVFGSGIYLQGAEDTIVANNVVERCNEHTDLDLLAPGCVGVTNMKLYTIEGNVIRDGFWHGITVRDPNGLGESASQGVIRGNRISGCAQDGIEVLRTANLLIEGNACISNQYGINLVNHTNLSSQKVTIANNRLIWNANAGVEAWWTTNLLVRGNHAEGSQIGINLANVSHAIVTDNMVTDSTVYGMAFVTNQVTYASGNIVHGAAQSFRLVAGNVRFEDDNFSMAPTTGHYVSNIGQTVQTIADGDATPDVGEFGWYYKTGNTSATTITDFDGPDVPNRTFILVAGDTNTTIDFSATLLEGNGEVDLTLNNDDMILFRYDRDRLRWFGHVVR